MSKGIHLLPADPDRVSQSEARTACAGAVWEDEDVRAYPSLTSEQCNPVPGYVKFVQRGDQHVTTEFTDKFSKSGLTCP